MASYKLTMTFNEAVAYLVANGILFVQVVSDLHNLDDIYIVNLKLLVSSCRLGAQFFNLYMKDLQAVLAGCRYLAVNKEWVAMEAESFLIKARNQILGI
jgi:hypothetical protein